MNPAFAFGDEEGGEDLEVKKAVAINWSALLFVEHICSGNKFEIFRARYRKKLGQKKYRTSAIPVVVKILKRAYNCGELDKTAFEREFKLLQMASDEEDNELVVKAYGVAEGAPIGSWTEALTGLGLNTAYACALVIKDQQNKLSDFITSGSTSLERLRVPKSIALSLFRLHVNQFGIIVHADISPSNFFFDPEKFEVFISDFHRAFLFDDKEISSWAKGKSSRKKTPRSGSASLRQTVDIKNAAFEYIAPELVGDKAVLASRTSDIYSLGTLLYEVLASKKPWDGYTAESRLAAVRSGKILSMDALRKTDIPAGVIELISRCLSLDRVERPKIVECLTMLEQEYQFQLEEKYDIFLSYCWGVGDWRKPLTDLIYLYLRGKGYRVWMDTLHMKQNLKKSMNKGIENSDLALILLSPDYCNSAQCMFELRCIEENRKKFIVCIVEPGYWKTWKTSDGKETLPQSGRLAEFLQLQDLKYADASSAAVKGESNDFMEKRLHESKAMPCLCELLKEVIPSAPNKSPKPSIFRDTIDDDDDRNVVSAPQKAPQIQVYQFENVTEGKFKELKGLFQNVY